MFSVMKAGISVIAVCLLAAMAMQPVHAQEVSADYHKGKVLEVLEQGSTHDDFLNQELIYQSLKIQVDNGDVEVVKYGGNVALQPEQLVAAGDTVVMIRQAVDDRYRYDIVDRYRLNRLWILVGIFIVVVLACTRWRGAGALVSVTASLVVLITWLVPQLLTSNHPLWITAATLVGLAVLLFYMGHGFNRITHVSIICTLITLLGAAALALFSTWLLHLSGTGTEEALSLKYGFSQDIQLSSLLLAGMLLAALGVLDDVTTAQTQAVQELHEANPKLTTKQLFLQGFRIGRAHIISLVNTLVLVYAGASLPAFLLLTNFSAQPLWISLNSETIIEQIVQLLVGSTALVVAVPLTTAVAAWWFNGGGRQQQ